MPFNRQSVATAIYPTVELRTEDMIDLLYVKNRETVHLYQQIAGVQDQILGQKSELRFPEQERLKSTLGELCEIVSGDLPPANRRKIVALKRKPKNNSRIHGNDEFALFLDDSHLPAELIAVHHSETVGLDLADHEVINDKVSRGLAQRSSSNVIVTDVSRIIEPCAIQAPSCPPASVGVIDGCHAYVLHHVGPVPKPSDDRSSTTPSTRSLSAVSTGVRPK